MNLSENPDLLFYIFAGLFVLLYAVYLTRIIWLGIKTKSRVNHIFYKFFLRLSYFFLLLFSLLGPTFGSAQKEIPFSEKLIYFLVDLSESMNATDLPPSRLEKLKYELKTVITDIPNTRIGLIIYSDDAFVHSPLTNDKSALYTFVDVLSTDLISGDGSIMTSGINLALDKLMEEKGKDSFKGIVLFSDGEDFSESLDPYVNRARKEKIKIFTVGIGTSNGAKIKTSSDIVTSKLNSEQLISIAKETGATYFEISDFANETDLLVKKIKNQSAQTKVIKKYEAASNKYFYFLLAALLLMVADVLITLNILKI